MVKKTREEKESLKEYKSFIKTETILKNKNLKWYHTFKDKFEDRYNYSQVGWINSTKDVIVKNISVTLNN